MLENQHVDVAWALDSDISVWNFTLMNSVSSEKSHPSNLVCFPFYHVTSNCFLREKSSTIKWKCRCTLTVDWSGSSLVSFIIKWTELIAFRITTASIALPLLAFPPLKAMEIYWVRMGICCTKPHSFEAKDCPGFMLVILWKLWLDQGVWQNRIGQELEPLLLPSVLCLWLTYTNSHCELTKTHI